MVLVANVTRCAAVAAASPVLNLLTRRSHPTLCLRRLCALQRHGGGHRRAGYKRGGAVGCVQRLPAADDGTP